MHRRIVRILAVLAITTISCGRSCADPVKVETIVEDYYKATDLQREGIFARYKTDTIIASGIVEDVKEDATFDVVNDVRRRYYKVITETLKDPQENHYRIVLVYKDLANVKNMAKGQKIAMEGRLLRLVDEGLFLSVWLSEEKLSAEEMALFK